MRKVTCSALAAIGVLALVGCGGSGGTVLGLDSNPRIRLVDASSAPATTTVRVDDETIASSAAYQYVSDYKIFENGNHAIKFLDGTTSASLIDQSELLELNHYYTAVAYGNSEGNLSLMFVSDKASTSTDDGQIRVLNASAGNVDVYITAPDADIIAASPTISDEAPGDTTQNYTTAALNGSASGSFQIRVTLPGTKTPIATTTVTLNSHDVKTVLVTTNGAARELLPLPTVKY